MIKIVIPSEKVISYGYEWIGHVKTRNDIRQKLLRIKRANAVKSNYRMR